MPRSPTSTSSADGRLVDGVDVRESFLWALEKVSRSSFELLVVSGDLAAEKEESHAYPWIAEQLATLPIPLMVMSGNHDDTPKLVESFGLEADWHQGSIRTTRTHGGVSIYCIDTSSEYLPEHQMVLAPTAAGRTTSPAAALPSPTTTRMWVRIRGRALTSQTS